MSDPFPPCRHRREPRHRSAHLCRSPKVAGRRLVGPDVCRRCPFADHPGGEPIADVGPDTPAEAMAALLDGPARAWPPGWADWENTHRAHRLAVDRFLATLGPYPADRFAGRGIVIAGGGPDYFPSVYVAVRAVRHVGCSLPIQVWYLGREDELPADRRAVLERHGVECVDADAVRRRHPFRILNGWELKVFAAIHSPFAELLSLDADCYPVRDPTPLFDDPAYRRTGAAFWPDFAFGPPLDRRPFGLPPAAGPSIESGQFVVDKSACWRPLRLAGWLNEHSDWSYLHGYGDKHTLEVGWAWCGRPFAMYRDAPGWSAHSFVHDGPDGRPLFVHRCQDKFRFGPADYLNPQAFAANRFNPALPLEAECFGWRAELRRELDGGPAVPTLFAVLYTCPERRAVFDGTLARWRRTDWGADPEVIVDADAGPTSTVRLAATARRAVEAAAAADADYTLLLEDDLLFNLHLRHNLLAWPPLAGGRLWMGSLYNPSLAADADGVVAPGGYYGALAVVLSREAVRTVLAEWEAVPAAFDIKLAIIAERHSPGVVLHHPSLVQHVPGPSTWGGGPSRTMFFDPFFRAGG